MGIHSRTTQYFTSPSISVLNARCNNPVREGVIIIAIGHHGSILGRGRRCLFSKVSGPALVNDQPPTQHVPRLDDGA
jgi:hypothetical protein